MRTIFFTLSALSLLIGQTATQPDGSGTSGAPYQISRYENLYWVTQNSASWSAYFQQTSHIDLPASITTWDTNQGWTPIGNTTTPFKGNYDGQGYTIAGLYLNRSNTGNVGFFGLLGYDADSVVVRRVHLEDVEIRGGRGAGSLVGRVIGDHKTLIHGSSAINGTVAGDGATGGLVGANNSYVESPSNKDQHPVIRNCYADIDVSWTRRPDSGADKFGGLTGCNQKGKIFNSYARGSVTVDNDPAVTVLNPQDGATTPSRIGGLSGCILIRGNVENAYSCGMVYTSGSVTYVGGFVGRGGTGGADGDTYASFWDTQTSGQLTSSPTSGCTGKTTVEMQTATTYTNAGWDFVSTWELVGSNYPRLQQNVDSSLPVELTNFNAVYREGAVVLTWRTESETENLGFILERKLQNGNWEHVADYTIDNALIGQGSSPESHQYVYQDGAVTPGNIYHYRLSDVDYSGTVTVHPAVDVLVTGHDSVVPAAFALREIYPNPFNPRAVINYQLPEPVQVSVTIYNIRGQFISTLVDAHQDAGSYHLDWTPEEIAAGIYLVRIQAGRFVDVRKCVMVK